MLRLIDVIVPRVVERKRFAGETIGYYHILAIDYARRDVLFRDISTNKLVSLNKGASHLQRWFRFKKRAINGPLTRKWYAEPPTNGD